MFVGLKMLKDFHTVTPGTLVKDAQKILDAEDLWMLLVKDGDELVGYVRKEDIMAALPSVMTSLEKHELKYLMSKLTVDKLIRRDIVTVAPEKEIEAAAHEMWKKRLAGLAVMNHRGRLIGYINRSVMLEVLVEEMGYEQGGSRICIKVDDRTGVIRDVSTVIADMDVSIISTGTFFHNGSRLVVIRMATDDPSAVAAALQERGYGLVGPMDFMHEWS
ncbi:MAG: CBS domain-containing protein [Desulfovibrionaceae bacterium]|jgi:acetoin utilization protein AcuB|nr:CBS domain-containing protein [Desulfovibrionaceae bacterium]